MSPRKTSTPHTRNSDSLAMRIYLVRHSVPETDPDDIGTKTGNPDFDPPLTDIGREYAQTLAQWMLDKDETPNIIFASPKLRTQETAEIIREAIGLSSVDTKHSIGPQMSIKKLVEKVAGDKSFTRVAIVSHHESIEHGLRVLNREPWVHLDMFAQCELRIMKVDRNKFTWDEHRRIVPSDLGGRDYY
jgi:phosphohistidine phosphatase SixA